MDEVRVTIRPGGRATEITLPLSMRGTSGERMVRELVRELKAAFRPPGNSQDEKERKG